MTKYEVYAYDTYWGTWSASDEQEAIAKALDHVCGPEWKDTAGLYAIEISNLEGLTQ